MQRIQGVIGTQGIGFVALAPTLGSDCQNVWYTNAAFAGTAAAILSANNTPTTGVLVATPTQLPYTADILCNQTQLDNERISGRIVAAGLKVTYTGTVLNQSGMYYGLTEPNHGCVSGATQADIGSYQCAAIRPVTRMPLLVVAHPLTDVEDQPQFLFSASSSSHLLYPLSNANTAFNTTYRGPTAYAAGTPIGIGAGGPVSIIIISGVAGQTFQIDVIQHVEYMGNLSQATQTRTHQDAAGAEIVRAAVDQTVAQQSNSYMDTYRKWKSFVGFATEVASDVLSSVVTPDLVTLRLD